MAVSGVSHAGSAKPPVPSASRAGMKPPSTAPYGSSPKTISSSETIAVAAAIAATARQSRQSLR